MDNKLNPITSVIVPCYNQSKYLAEALESVIVQTYPHWECIIVNDGATDDTESISGKYLEKDARFKYVYKENGGLSSARNTGIRSSVGKYILPLDADDKIGPDYIKQAVHFFETNPDTSLVYAQAELFGLKTGEWQLSPYSYTDLLKSNMIFCSAVFKRAGFDRTCGYDEHLRAGYEDWDFFLRLLNPDSVVHQLNACHFYYRIKRESMLTDITIAKQQELNHFIYNKYQDIYKMHFESPINLLRKLEIYERMYKNSSDYKLGNKLLNPIRYLVKTVKSIFK